MSDPFETWVQRQYRCSAQAMLRSISPVDIVKHRTGFGHSVRGARGAVVASPMLGDYDPQPDYFFHWYRDSALVMDALRRLYMAGEVGASAPESVGDFVRFSHALCGLDGRRLVADERWRGSVSAAFVPFLRTPTELAAVHGQAVALEARVNADGTLDCSRWNRPQTDGPPLRALTLLRWLEAADFDAATGSMMGELLRADLDLTRRHWREPSYDIWEEELGRHYYNLRVSAAALTAGSGWLAAAGEIDIAHRCDDEVDAIFETLDDFWQADAACYRSRDVGGGNPAKTLDIAVILAVIHADGEDDRGARHSVRDERMHATLARLETFFDRSYPINRARETPVGVAMGRYPGDVYYAGGAYCFSTLGAAEFCFMAARCAADVSFWIDRGDGFLRSVRRWAPDDGLLPEQYDQRSGAPTSALNLAWSHAAFVSCIDARRRVVDRA